MDALKDFVFEQKYNENVDRLRISYFYRGLANVDYKLVTTMLPGGIDDMEEYLTSDLQGIGRSILLVNTI